MKEVVGASEKVDAENCEHSVCGLMWRDRTKVAVVSVDEKPMKEMVASSWWPSVEYRDRCDWLELVEVVPAADVVDFVVVAVAVVSGETEVVVEPTGVDGVEAGGDDVDDFDDEIGPVEYAAAEDVDGVGAGVAVAVAVGGAIYEAGDWGLAPSYWAWIVYYDLGV